MPAFPDIQVLDLTHVFADPSRTCRLAVMEADVIRAGPPRDPVMVQASGLVVDGHAREMPLKDGSFEDDDPAIHGGGIDPCNDA